MRFYLSSLLLLFFVQINGQQKALTNEAIWDFEFSQETLASIHPLKSQSAYTVIKVDYEKRQAKIILYDYATAKELAVLVDSSTSAQIPFFTAYYFSEDEQKILLGTDAGYGFIATVGDLFTKNKAGKALQFKVLQMLSQRPLKFMSSIFKKRHRKLREVARLLLRTN